MSNFTIHQLNNITEDFPKDYFIETGTYLGETTMLAANVFENVFSIEASPKLFLRAAQRLRTVRRPHFLLGDTRHVLPLLIEAINGPIVFYLDAHWFKQTDEPVTKRFGFPLFDELDIIVEKQKDECIIIVDDVHAFGQAKYGWSEVTEETIRGRVNHVQQAYVTGDQYVLVRDRD